MKILLAASGSGGHIYPALALKKSLLEKAEVGFVIVRGSLEEKLVVDTRVEKIMISVKNQARFYLKHPFMTWGLYKTIRQLSKKIKEYDKVICFGGFITCIVGFAAKMAKVPYYLHEQNAILGDANKVMIGDAKKVFTVYEDLKIKDKYQKKILCLGNPRATEAHLKKVSSLKEIPFKVLFVAGSLGSETLIKVIKEMLENFSFTNVEFTIISGSKHLKLLDKMITTNRVNVIAYCGNLLETMAKSHLLIMRAGATSITEMMALQIPSIVIPSPYVKHDHQTENARFLKDHGLAIVLEEKTLDACLLSKKILELKTSYETRLELKMKMRKIAKVNAAINIREEILKS